MQNVLVTGATGYVGGQLVPALLAQGHRVRALARTPGKAREALPPDVEVVQGDVVTGEGLAAALEGIDVAYYLVHAMGRGNPHDFAEQDRRGARAFGDAARQAGVARVVYLGGLEDHSPSEHLRSRHEVALLLRERVAELVYVRAAMVIGEGSASFQMLKSLVEKLPVMITPKWVSTRTQPIAIRDVVRTLATLAARAEVPGEVQLGGADVLSYKEMMERFAEVSGSRRPAIVGVPVLSPKLSSHWVSLFTPVDSALIRPLVEGLGTEMLVATPPPPGINDDPLGFDDAVREALRGDTSS